MSDVITAPAATPTTASTITAPVTTSVSTQAPAVTTETVNPGSWTAGFNDELKGYVTTKGFKDPSAVTDAYRNLEKLMGGDRKNLLKVPDQFVDDTGAYTAEAREIYERLGAPKDPKEYGLDKLSKTDPKMLEELSQTFHNLGISKTQAEKLLQWNNQVEERAALAQKEASVAKYKDQDTSLRKNWGAAYDQNVALAKQGYTRLGHDIKTIDALAQVLGHEGAMKFYHQMGTAVAESAFISGRTAAPTILDPNSAKSQIAALKSDKGFVEKFGKGDSEAIQKLQRLTEMAYPGQMSLR